MSQPIGGIGKAEAMKRIGLTRSELEPLIAAGPLSPRQAPGGRIKLRRDELAARAETLVQPARITAIPAAAETAPEHQHGANGAR
jgi:hypothetical protein